MDIIVTRQLYNKRKEISMKIIHHLLYRVKLINRKLFFHLLSALAVSANITAKIGACTASSWGDYQPLLPKELNR